MDLWIRSQDRTKLICCNDIAITTYSEDGKTIRGYKIVGYFDKNTEYENLGFYTLRERALEVLDDIQNILMFKNMLNINSESAINSIIEKYSSDEQIKTIKNACVYKMPEK